jgi:hypothetical protein
MVALMGIGETGLRGDAGGTFMSNMFARLSMMGSGKGGGKLRKGMTEFLGGTGFQLSDIYDLDKGQFQDFNKFMDLLATADVAKVSKLKGAFGMQGGKAIGALAQLDISQLLKFRMEMVETDGAAMRMAATLMEGLPGAMVRLDSAWETTKLVMMAAFVPALAAVIQTLANFLAHLQKDHPWILQVAFALVGMTTAIIGVGMALWIATGALGAWGIALGFAGRAIGWLLIRTGLMTTVLWLKAAAMGAVSVATLVMKGAWMLLNAVFLATPIGWIVLAIGALIAIITLCVAKTNSWADAFKLLSGIIIKSAITPMNIMIKTTALLLRGLSYLPNMVGGDMFGNMADSLEGAQDKMNTLLTGNKSITAMGMIYDIYQDEKGGSQASSWIEGTTKKSAEERNGVMMQNVTVQGDIKVSADPNSTVDYTSFDFNVGNNMGGV